VRPFTEPARPAGLADLDVLVLLVRHLTDRGAALDVDLADFAARQLHRRVRAVLRHQLRRDARRTHELTAAPLLHLEPVDHRAYGDVLELEAIAGADVGGLAGDDLVTDLQSVRSEDVALLAVRVVEEGDARGAVRVVLDRRNESGDADLVTTEIDEPEAPLVP